MDMDRKIRTGIGPWVHMPKEDLDELRTAIKAYMPFLEGKAGTGWCMHDRGTFELDAVAAYQRLKAVLQGMRTTRV